MVTSANRKGRTMSKKMRQPDLYAVTKVDLKGRYDKEERTIPAGTEVGLYENKKAPLVAYHEGIFAIITDLSQLDIP